MKPAGSACYNKPKPPLTGKVCLTVLKADDDISGGGTSLNTLKIQFILQTNYDKLDILIEKHEDSIHKCLRPLVNEILDVDPNPNDEEEFKKLFRKISIYIILNSGLGNPGFIVVSIHQYYTFRSK